MEATAIRERWIFTERLWSGQRWRAEMPMLTRLGLVEVTANLDRPLARVATIVLAEDGGVHQELVRLRAVSSGRARGYRSFRGLFFDRAGVRTLIQIAGILTSAAAPPLPA